MTKETAYFCPSCGSPSVDHSVLVGGNASCKKCGWSGPNSELLAHDFEHDFTSPEAMVDMLVRDVSNVLVKLAAVQLGHVLVKWGFLDATHKDAAKHLRQYMIEAGKAMTISFVQTRERIASGHYEREAKVDLPKGIDVPGEKPSGN